MPRKSWLRRRRSEPARARSNLRQTWRNAILRSINLNALCSAVEHARFRWAGALVHVVARGLSGGEAAGAALLSFALPGRRQRAASGSGGPASGRLPRSRCISFAWTASVTVYVAFHDDVIGAILTRQAEMKAAYEDRLAEARARLDEAASRQLLERNSFNGKVNEVISRQARLEQRGAIVAALAGTEARNARVAARRQAATPNPADALSAIEALGPSTAPRASVEDSARAYAPLPGPGVEPRAVKPHPIDESGETLSAVPSDAPFTTASMEERQTISIPRRALHSWIPRSTG